jgi:hypothetical protein
MAIKTEFTLNITRFKNTNQNGSNTQRTWTRYGYMNPSSPYYNISTFRPEDPQLSDNDLEATVAGEVLSGQINYTRLFPTSDYIMPLGTHAVSALFLEKEGDNEVLPEAIAGDPNSRFHGSGKVYRAEAGETLPANPAPATRNGARIVFQIFGGVRYEETGWQSLLIEHSGVILHRDQAQKRYLNFQQGVLTEWSWDDVVFSDYFQGLTKLEATEATYDISTPEEIKFILVDEKISVPYTQVLYKDLTDNITRKDKPIFQGPPLLVNNLHQNGLPLGFDIKGTKLFYNGAMNGRNIMAPSMYNIGPVINDTQNCRVYGAVGHPNFVAAGGLFSVLEHVIGATPPSDFAAHNASLVGRKVRNREGTFSGTITIANYTIGSKGGALFDIDLNGAVDALTDGLLVLRYLFGLTNDSLISNAISTDSLRDTGDDIGSYIDQLIDSGWLDIDGNGTADALTDGLLMLRYLFGLTGDALINNAIATNATRDVAEIQEILDTAISKQVRLNEDQSLYIAGDGQPVFSEPSQDAQVGGSNLTQLVVQIDGDSLLTSPSSQDDMYIEMYAGEELNNIRNSAEKDSQGSASFNLEEWTDNEYVSHITSQDTKRPNSWIPHDFYGDAMLVVEPIAVGAYTCNVGVKTEVDTRSTRKVDLEIDYISNDLIQFKGGTSSTHNVRINDTILIVNNGVSTVPNGYFKSSSNVSNSFIIVTTTNNAQGIGTHEGPFDDIEIYEIGGQGGSAPVDKYTNFQVQGYAGPTQEVTLTNENTDYRKSERIAANIDMLPVGEIVLVKYDKEVSFYETIEDDLNLTQSCPPYIKIDGSNTEGGFRDNLRASPTFMAGDVVLPSTFQNTHECLFHFTDIDGRGISIGMSNSSGTPKLQIVIGDSRNLIPSVSNRIIEKSISSIPEFDDKSHTVAWEFNSTTDKLRFFIDNRSVLTESLYLGNSATNPWGSQVFDRLAVGGWLQGHETLEPALRRRWSGKGNSHLRIYSLQSPAEEQFYNIELPRKYTPDEQINGNCRVKDIGGNQQIITPIAGGSRYRTVTEYNYNLLQSPSEGLTKQSDIDQLTANPRVASKRFQVEGNVRSVPLESVAQFTAFEDQINVSQFGQVIPQTLQGTDGIRCVFKLNNTFASEEEMEDFRGKIIDVEMINQSGGTLARTAGPLKILDGRLQTNYFDLYSFLPGRNFYISSWLTDQNNFTRAEHVRRETDYITLTQENIDAGHISVYLRHNWEYYNENTGDVTFPAGFSTGHWAHARANQVTTADGVWLGGLLPDDAWERLSDTKIKFHDDLPLRVVASGPTIYWYLPSIVIVSTENRETTGFVPDSLIHDSSIFVPDGTSETWSATLRLTLEKDGLSYYYQSQFSGDYKKEYGIDILEPTGESRLNSNSKPLRFVSSASGEQTPSGLVDGEIPVGSEDANGIEDLGHPWRPFSYAATTPGYLDAYWNDPKDGSSEGYSTIGNMWPMNNLWTERPANGNVDTSHKQTIYIDIYYGGQLVVSTTGRRSGAQLIGPYNGLATTDSLQISEAGVEYQRTNAKIIADDRSQVWYLYDRNVPGDFVQPITYDTPQYLVIPNDNLSEQEFVVVNNEPESMVGVELDTANGRYNIVPTDWPNDPVDDVSSFDRSNNYGRQDWHLNHKYALQALRVK